MLFINLDEIIRLSDVLQIWCNKIFRYCTANLSQCFWKIVYITISSIYYVAVRRIIVCLDLSFLLIYLYIYSHTFIIIIIVNLLLRIRKYDTFSVQNLSDIICWKLISGLLSQHTCKINFMNIYYYFSLFSFLFFCIC